MFLEQIINGIAIGMSYALVAVGYSMVFGVLRLINFSHSAVFTFGAFAVWVGVEALHLNVALSILLSIVITGFLGIGLNKMALEPLRKKGETGMPALITTIGMSYIIVNVLTIVFGAQIRRFPAIFNWGQIKILGASIGWQQIMIALACLILLLILSLIVNKTKSGLAMRAVQQQATAAAINGINVNYVITFVFFLGAASAAIGGTLVASYYQYVRPSFGDVIGLKAFAAAVLGGIGSLPGAVLGGLIIGVVESMAVFALGSTYIDLVAYLVMFAVLLIKPTGLLGRKGIKKV